MCLFFTKEEREQENGTQNDERGMGAKRNYGTNGLLQRYSARHFKPTQHGSHALYSIQYGKTHHHESFMECNVITMI